MRRIWIAATMALSLSSVGAEVVYTDWGEDNLKELVGEAGRDNRLIMLVIAQMDWCPACIRLDRDLLSNPRAGAIRDLTRDWLVLEIFGYDDAGSALLAEHEIRFLGTPTTLIFQPGPDTRLLGEARVIGGIVGYPEDFLDRLTDIANGWDALAAAQRGIRESGGIENFLTLARVFVEQGNAPAAARVFQSLLFRNDLEPEQRRDIRWESIISVVLRVKKDPQRALIEIDTFGVDYPAFARETEFAYRKSWALLELARIDEARAILNASFRDAGTSDRTYDYLYLIFRNPHPSLLAEAEAVARDAVGKYPEEAALFNHALGRLLRRQSRYIEAADAFRRAVELADKSDENYPVYLGQLDFVLTEVASESSTSSAGSNALEKH